jgi:hypothetical protein
MCQQGRRAKIVKVHRMTEKTHLGKVPKSLVHGDDSQAHGTT